VCRGDAIRMLASAHPSASVGSLKPCAPNPQLYPPGLRSPPVRVALPCLYYPVCPSPPPGRSDLHLHQLNHLEPHSLVQTAAASARRQRRFCLRHNAPTYTAISLPRTDRATETRADTIALRGNSQLGGDPDPSSAPEETLRPWPSRPRREKVS